jgi:hypothetical protein
MGAKKAKKGIGKILKRIKKTGCRNATGFNSVYQIQHKSIC